MLCSQEVHPRQEGISVMQGRRHTLTTNRFAYAASDGFAFGRSGMKAVCAQTSGCRRGCFRDRTSIRQALLMPVDWWTSALF